MAVGVRQRYEPEVEEPEEVVDPVTLFWRAVQSDSFYDEARTWIAWMQSFTASDIADAMAVDFAVGAKMCRAAEWHGIIKDTGDSLPGPEGDEPIWEYVPPPPGPSEHETQTPPERFTPGCYELAPIRGEPIRIRTERDMRRSLSTPGARQKHRMRELLYQRQQQAREEAFEKAREKLKRKREQGKKDWE